MKELGRGINKITCSRVRGLILNQSEYLVRDRIRKLGGARNWVQIRVLAQNVIKEALRERTG